MWRDAWFIARKDLQYMLRSRETVLWVFVMPVVFFYFIGTITAGFGPGDTREEIVLVSGDRPGFLADQLERRLQDRGYDVVRTNSIVPPNDHRLRLVLPAAFTDSVLSGIPVVVRLVRAEEDGLSGPYDAIRTGRAVYSLLADLVVTSEEDAIPTPVTFEQLNAMPRALRLQVRPAGQRKRIPTGFEQAVPGTMVMFTLLVMTTSGAVLLVIERRQGLLRRIAYTPIHRTGLVLGKWMGKLGLGVTQMAFAMGVGSLVFGMRWGPDLAMVVLVLLAYGALMAALGMLLGSVARTEGQAIGIGVLSANVLAALGGCWWPIEVTPGWMQKLQLFLPTGWAMDALHKLVLFESGPSSTLVHFFGMSLATLLLLRLVTRVFRFE